MFDPTNPKNKFGYYSVGPFLTYSKFQALDYQLLHGGNLEWHFNDDVFDQFDWRTEPTQSLDSLYRQRAQQIRDSYDYVVLMYSGGIDSSHMVKVFFDNKIYPDEICSVHEYQGTDNKHAFLTGEIFNSALPFINQNVDTQHHTKFRIVDSAKAQFDAVAGLNEDSIRENMYHWTTAHNLGNLARFDVRRLVPEYQSIMQSGRRLCLVWGESKPRIDLDPVTNKHQVHFNEGYDMICNAYHQDSNDPARYDELFYTTPDMPEIVSKQCHLLLKVIHNQTTFNDVMLDRDLVGGPVMSKHAPGFKIWSPLHSMIATIRNSKYKEMLPQVVNQIIYPGSQPVIYDQGKNVDRLIHPRDQWIRNKLPEISKQFYTKFLQQVGRYKFETTRDGFNGSGKFAVPKSSKAYDLE